MSHAGPGGPSPYEQAGSPPSAGPAGAAAPPGYGPPGYGPPPGQAYPGYPPYGAPGPWVGQPPPDKHIGWAIGALILFWPLCIPAFIASLKVSDLWFTGRYQESLQASADAKRWGKLGVIIGASLSGLGLLVYLVMFAVLISAGSTFSP